MLQTYEIAVNASAMPLLGNPTFKGLCSTIQEGTDQNEVSHEGLADGQGAAQKT
jgi:hypothetical protein